jgi:drug/metabolite transporter (DMT)-like permease
MTRRSAEILLAVCLALRGSSLLFSKLAMRSIEPLTLIALRFLLSSVVLAVIFWRRMIHLKLREVAHSAVIGFLLFIMMVLELNGLKTTPSSVTAFIENSAIVFVPIIAATLDRRLPDIISIGASAIAIVGIGFLTLSGTKVVFSSGELLIIGSAFFFSLSIIATDRIAKEDDVYVVGILEQFFVGIFAVINAYAFEPHSMPQSAGEWGMIIYLALVCSGIGFTFQPLAQKYTSPEKASIFEAFNPLTATILGIIFLSEDFTAATLVGACLVMLSVYFSTVVEARKAKSRRKKELAQNAMRLPEGQGMPFSVPPDRQTGTDSGQVAAGSRRENSHKSNDRRRHMDRSGD